jgi:hypothetical protein
MTAHEPLALDYPREHVFPPEESSMSNEHQPPPPPTQFGVFYPLGHVVVALESREDADRMRQLLIDGGYDEHDVTLWTGPQVATAARELQQSASVIAKIFGAELEAMNKHIELADAGYTFVVAYCPSDLDTKRLMNVANRFRYSLAQKYDRFSITDL